MQEGNENWMPLESNPEVINTFIQKMGLKTQLFSFQQMLSTQQWALQMIPKPALGVLMLYQVTPVQTQHKNQQAENLDPSQTPHDMFFMKQYAQNACGTIGLFHIILNAAKNYPDIITPNSYLDKFKNDGSAKNAQDRGKLFKNSKQILNEHKSSANEGQSQVQENVDSHFISFIHWEGRLYEMDGFKKCPVDHGPCTEDILVSRASQVIRKYMERDPDNIHFSMLVLAATQQ